MLPKYHDYDFDDIDTFFNSNNITRKKKDTCKMF